MTGDGLEFALTMTLKALAAERLAVAAAVGDGEFTTAPELLAGGEAPRGAGERTEEMRAHRSHARQGLGPHAEALHLAVETLGAEGARFDEIDARARQGEGQARIGPFGAVVINSWNRLAISFRAVAGSYQPAAAVAV